MNKIIKSIVSIFAVLSLFSACTVQNNSSNTTTNKTTVESSTKDRSTTENSSTPEVTEVGSDFADFTRSKVIWGPGIIKEHKRPNDPVSLQETFGKLSAKFILDDTKTICLTFDEGYENGYTPAILDTLKEKKVRAIFFVTYDFAKDNPELIKRMIKEGHVVGNHTYRHYTMDEVELSVAEEEITYLHDYIRDNFNYKMTLFRFPKGEFSEQTLFLVQSLGYNSVFWSFAYEDWNTESTVSNETALNTITESSHNGAIFLLHAVSKTNAEVLGDAIDRIQKQGYKFTTNL